MGIIKDYWKVCILAIAFLIAPLIANANSNAQLISAYTYHLKPPYIIDLESETGLYFDFVDYLSQKVPGFQFHLTYLPRKRLDIYLERNQLNGIIVGVNPAWFKDREEKKYFWTPKIFDDRDDVVSNIQSPLEYQGPESLFGKTIGGVLGYYYFGINEAVGAGKVSREDANSERALLEMIYHKRVTAGIVSNATFNYLVVKHGWQGRFHLSQQPHDLYTRHVLVPLNLEEVSAAINTVIDNIPNDPAWHKILDKYRIKF